MSHPSVFVAGASGVVGTRVVRALLERGHDVTGLTRSRAHAAMLAGLGATPVIADVYRADELRAIMMASRPDVVVHQLTDLREQDSCANARLRREGTANLMAAASEAGVGRVVAQSIAWAYEPTDQPAAEDTPLDLSSTGARFTTVSAVEALEGAVLDGPHGVVLRYGMLYGPGTWFTRTGSQARAAREGRVTADRSATSFVHVDDAAAAAVAAIGWPSGVVNIVDDEPARALEWVPDFCRFAGAPPPRVAPGRVPWAAGAANDLARSLGWVPSHPSWRGNWGMCSLN